MVETILFVLAALAALAGAVTVVLARNPIYSAVGLLGTLFSVAILYVVQLAHLVAAVQVIVYAGAVMTLFLFVIMLIGVDKEENREETLPRQRFWVGSVAGVIVLFAAGVALFGDFAWVPAAGDPVDQEMTNGTVQAIAEPLFTDWVLAFEATALLLTIAAAGAIVLAQFRRKRV
ncbi:MAG TPA: NADH-quinone oxidoreductase subunit J [Acidimicrobiia bacterium]|nr:NADH-quinone oxidoreductase subunit J [Acidimicrobiia bacterium]